MNEANHSVKVRVGVLLLIIFPFISYGHWFTYSTIVSSLLTKARTVLVKPTSGSNEQLFRNNQHSKKPSPVTGSFAYPEYYEQRFEPLKNELPLDKAVGYMTDRGGVYATPIDYYLTQYVLAPVVILRDMERELVIGNFSESNIINKIKADTFYCSYYYSNNKDVMDQIREEKGLILIGPKFGGAANVKVGVDAGKTKCSRVKNITLLKDFGNGVAVFKRGKDK